MIFEQKLVISKIWAKNTKNRQNWGFSLILGGQKFKNRKNDLFYLITSTSCTSCANFKSFRLIPHYSHNVWPSKKVKKRLSLKKAVLVKKNFGIFFWKQCQGKFYRGNFFLKFFFSKKIEKNCWKNIFEKNCWSSNNFT